MTIIYVNFKIRSLEYKLSKYQKFYLNYIINYYKKHFNYDINESQYLHLLNLMYKYRNRTIMEQIFACHLFLNTVIYQYKEA